MNQLTANRLTRRKELQKDDAYHKANLEAIRTKKNWFRPSLTSVVINHSKRQQLKEARDREIERENRSLLNRMGDIRARNNVRSLKTHLRASSLNEGARSRQQQAINLENLRFVGSLQNTGPTLDLKRIRKDWAHHQRVVQCRAKDKSNLTDFAHAAASSPSTLEPLNPEVSPAKSKATAKGGGSNEAVTTLVSGEGSLGDTGRKDGRRG